LWGLALAGEALCRHSLGQGNGREQPIDGEREGEEGAERRNPVAGRTTVN
jgi:hypothetical protein